MLARLGEVLCVALVLVSGFIATAYGATGRIFHDFYCGAPLAGRCKGICDPFKINVVISKRGQVKWNGQTINQQTLKSEAEKLIKADPGGMLFEISADPATSYGSFAVVVYELQRLGAQHMYCELPINENPDTHLNKLGH